MAIKAPKLDLKKSIEKLAVLKDVFSLRNLTVSLLSALLVIGLGYLSSMVGTALQAKAYSNPMIYSTYVIITVVAYFLVITGPAFLAAFSSKKWESFAYIIFLEVLWLAIFVAVLFFTTPTTTPSFQDMITQ